MLRPAFPPIMAFTSGLTKSSHLFTGFEAEKVRTILTEKTLFLPSEFSGEVDLLTSVPTVAPPMHFPHDRSRPPTVSSGRNICVLISIQESHISDTSPATRPVGWMHILCSATSIDSSPPSSEPSNSSSQYAMLSLISSFRKMPPGAASGQGLLLAYFQWYICTADGHFKCLGLL